MRICMLASTHKPKDTRIYWKESMALNEIGCKVIIISMSNGKCPESEKDVSWILIKKPGNRFVRFLLTGKLLLSAIATNCDVYQINDGEILWFSVFLRILRRKAKIVYDAHEPLSIFISQKSWVPKLLKGIVKKMVNIYEHIFSKFCDSVIAVAKGNELKFKRWNVTTHIVRNFPIFDEKAETIPWENRENTFLYVGLISTFRGLQQMIQFAEKLERYEKKYKIVIIGNYAPGQRRTIENMIANISQDVFEIRNVWMDHTSALKEIGRAKFGFSLFDKKILSHVANTTTNKIFEYMLYGAIPIVTYVPELKEYIEHMKTGVFLSPGNEAEELCNLLPEIETKGRKISMESIKKAKENYLWDYEKKRYTNVFLRL